LQVVDIAPVWLFGKQSVEMRGEMRGRKPNGLFFLIYLLLSTVTTKCVLPSSLLNYQTIKQTYKNQALTRFGFSDCLENVTKLGVISQSAPVSRSKTNGKIAFDDKFGPQKNTNAFSGICLVLNSAKLVLDAPIRSGWFPNSDSAELAMRQTGASRSW
jgi:hypothetical protein